MIALNAQAEPVPHTSLPSERVAVPPCHSVVDEPHLIRAVEDEPVPRSICRIGADVNPGARDAPAGPAIYPDRRHDLLVLSPRPIGQDGGLEV